MKYIDEHEITNKHVLLRVDFNVSLNPNYTIADDVRIQQGLPTIQYLLKHHNKIILVTHLGRPEGREEKFSLQKVAKDLASYLPHHPIRLISDFLTEPEDTFTNQDAQEILLLENIRFYPEEQKNDHEFAKKLASLAEVFVNDAFSVSHREDASVCGVTEFLPAYAGLLMKKEITNLTQAIKDPKKPVVAILGGSKVSTKITLIKKLCQIADVVLLGGGLANTFLAHDYALGKSLVEKDDIHLAQELVHFAKRHHTHLLLPHDVVVSTNKEHHTSRISLLSEIGPEEMILDIGPATMALYGQQIAQAQTLIWNGPLGYFENPTFKAGTDFVYYSIAQNPTAFSIVGGGETLSAIEKKEYLDAISHISTGGGAMLEFIENSTLPGIQALGK